MNVLSANSLLIIAGISLGLSVLFFSLTAYYAHLMGLELSGRLPESSSRWFWLWFMRPFGHAKFCPESKTRRKLVACLVGMLFFGYVGLAAWMRH